MERPSYFHDVCANQISGATPAFWEQKAIAKLRPCASNKSRAMNQSPSSNKHERPPATVSKPIRGSLLAIAMIAGLVVIAVVFIAMHRKPEGQAVGPAPIADLQAKNDSKPATPEATAPVPTPAVAQADSTVAPTNTDRSAVARELVKRLSEIEMQPGGITPESAAKWNRDLESLVEQGTAAIQPLDEFFQSKTDVRFDMGTTNLLGEPSLRMAFIEVLFNIPAPDNVDLQERILRETSDPAEVALLGRQLEAQEPGKYKGLIVYAAQTALDQANHGQWPGRDTRPLLKILNTSGALK